MSNHKIASQNAVGFVDKGKEAFDRLRDIDLYPQAASPDAQADTGGFDAADYSFLFNRRGTDRIGNARYNELKDARKRIRDLVNLDPTTNEALLLTIMGAMDERQIKDEFDIIRGEDDKKKEAKLLAEEEEKKYKDSLGRFKSAISDDKDFDAYLNQQPGGIKGLLKKYNWDVDLALGSIKELREKRREERKRVDIKLKDWGKIRKDLAAIEEEIEDIEKWLKLENDPRVINKDPAKAKFYQRELKALRKKAAEYRDSLDLPEIIDPESVKTRTPEDLEIAQGKVGELQEFVKGRLDRFWDFVWGKKEDTEGEGVGSPDPDPQSGVGSPGPQNKGQKAYDRLNKLNPNSQAQDEGQKAYDRLNKLNLYPQDASPSSQGKSLTEYDVNKMKGSKHYNPLKNVPRYVSDETPESQIKNAPSYDGGQDFVKETSGSFEYKVKDIRLIEKTPNSVTVGNDNGTITSHKGKAGFTAVDSNGNKTEVETIDEALDIISGKTPPVVEPAPPPAQKNLTELDQANTELDKAKQGVQDALTKWENIYKTEPTKLLDLSDGKPPSSSPLWQGVIDALDKMDNILKGKGQPADFGGTGSAANYLKGVESTSPMSAPPDLYQRAIRKYRELIEKDAVERRSNLGKEYLKSTDRITDDSDTDTGTVEPTSTVPTSDTGDTATTGKVMAPKAVSKVLQQVHGLYGKGGWTSKKFHTAVIKGENAIFDASAKTKPLVKGAGGKLRHDPKGEIQSIGLGQMSVGAASDTKFGKSLFKGLDLSTKKEGGRRVPNNPKDWAKAEKRLEDPTASLATSLQYLNLLHSRLSKLALPKKFNDAIRNDPKQMEDLVVATYNTGFGNMFKIIRGVKPESFQDIYDYFGKHDGFKQTKILVNNFRKNRKSGR